MCNVCRTCLKVVTDDAACLSLDTETETNYPSLRNKLSFCIPELALDVIEFAVICSLCAEALNTSYSFKNRCLQTEQKIIDFTLSSECSKSSINVSDLAEFAKIGDTEIDVKPIVCATAINPDLAQIKMEPEVEMNLNSSIPNYEMENSVANKIPFNPELDVEVRGYCTDMLNAYPFGNGSNADNINLLPNMYQCIYCQKSFELLPQFEAHLAMHAMQNRPLKCEMCERRFVRKDKLMLHMRIHTGEKPFKCTECGRCFSRKDKLNNHIRTHTGEKPHQCILCQKCFARKDKMNLHMKSQHWITLANLEITLVKNGENGNNMQPPAVWEHLPRTQ